MQVQVIVLIHEYIQLGTVLTQQPSRCSMLLKGVIRRYNSF